MPKMNLTAAAVERLRHPETGQVDYFDASFPAFGLRVGKTSKVYFLMTRIDGKQVRLSVGRARTEAYPGGMTLADARKLAGEWQAAAAAGDDPRLEKQAKRQDKEDARRNTFATVAAQFLRSYVARNVRESTAKEYRRALQGPDVAKWADRPISSIAKRDVLEMLDGILERGALSGANRQLAYLSKFFGWCCERDILEIAPTDRLRKPTRDLHRSRYLTVEEIPFVWRGLSALGFPFGPMFKLALLTGQREAECAGLRWDELHGLDGDKPEWRLAESRTKNGRPHVVPLAPQVVDMLRALPRIDRCPFVFSTNGRTHASGYSRAKARLDALIAEERQQAALDPLQAWRWHDLRRTFSTHLHDALRVPPHVVEAVINHISGAKAGVAGVYNHAAYLDDRRSALRAWADYLDRLVSGQQADNVVPLRAGQ